MGFFVLAAAGRSVSRQGRIMQTAFDIAADLDTPVSAYLKLRPLGARFLLESVERGEQLGRYSFIGVGGVTEVRLQATQAHCNGDVQPAPTTRAELLRFWRDSLERAPRLRPSLQGLPFQGGLVGATSFEMIDRLERVRNGEARGSARGSPPDGWPEAAYLSPRGILVLDNVTRSAALLHDGTEQERASLRREVISALRSSEPSLPGRRPSRHGTPTPSVERTSFLDGVERAKAYIRSGDIYQVVLSICFSGSCDVEPFSVYRALRLLNPSPYMYFLEFGDLSIVGSSPEALARLEGKNASLSPIAGTRRRGSTDEQDAALAAELRGDPKENAEHVMLVDLARNDLGRVAVPGSVRVHPYKTVERYSHVMHLVSGVVGTVAPEHDAFDLFAAAFPAGTVVGAPKIRAAEIIAELEPQPRGIYAGTVGYFGHGGSMDQAIAIRTLVFSGGRYAFQAGAGIVADSVPETEHEEVLAKAAALEQALTLAEEGL